MVVVACSSCDQRTLQTSWIFLLICFRQSFKASTIRCSSMAFVIVYPLMQHSRISDKNIIHILKFFLLFQGQTPTREDVVARRTHGTRPWSWRKSSSSIATSHEGDGSSSRTCCVSRKDKLKSGSKTGG